jgi:hypothetical protein
MFYLLFNEEYLGDTITVTKSYAEQLINLEGEGKFHARSSLYRWFPIYISSHFHNSLRKWTSTHVKFVLLHHSSYLTSQTHTKKYTSNTMLYYITDILIAIVTDRHTCIE